MRVVLTNYFGVGRRANETVHRDTFNNIAALNNGGVGLVDLENTERSGDLVDELTWLGKPVMNVEVHLVVLFKFTNTAKTLIEMLFLFPLRFMHTSLRLA